MGLIAPAGRVRVDCHLHTVASGDAVLTLEELAERARQTGLDVVDVIEVFNAKISDSGLNDRAADLAAGFDLPGGAGSDAHDASGVGAAYLEMPDFDGPAGFLAALADAQLTGEFRDHAARYPRRPVLPRRRGEPGFIRR
jgi:predicted metal-dependent phosphoesterase TrpH